MSFKLRIATWVVLSCILLIGVMMSTAYYQLEEELSQGRWDRTHPKVPGWVLHNSYSEEEIQDILGELLRTWLWTAGPLIGLSLGAGLLLARRSLRPVHEINHQLADMRVDSLHGGITIPESDPVIAELADHLNGLLDRAGTAYQEMAEFSARVAHELRTPLMLLRLRVEHAPPGIPAMFQEDLQDELARLSRFVERSLLAAKAEHGALIPVSAPLSLSGLAQDVTEDYRLLAAERGLTMNLELTENIHIHGDADLLRQALHGLLENAVNYAKSEILVTCRPENHWAVLTVHNDFDSTALPSAGLGLGLRLVRGICKASALEFEINQSPLDFNATIRFPTDIPTENADRNRDKTIPARPTNIPLH
jgi:signal transduction histidine kinase